MFLDLKEKPMTPGDLDEVYSAPSEPARQAPGAYLVNGNLFFRLLDGTSICCNCVGQPYAQAVVDLFNKRAL